MMVENDVAQLQWIVSTQQWGVLIFEQFVQLDEFRQGTGIGLTVARHATRLLGGEVWLDLTL